MKNTLPDVDEMLKTMAEETPEMPADFHARWTQAVRQEAEQAARGNRQQPDDAAVTRRDRQNQWKRLAGIAAVFVFLIGGTLLSRDSLRPTVQVETSDAALLMSNSASLVANERKSSVMDAAMPLGTNAPTSIPEPLALAAGMLDGGAAPEETWPETEVSEEAAPAEEIEEVWITEADEAMDSFAAEAEEDFGEEAEEFEEEMEEEEPEAAEEIEEEAAEVEEAESGLQRFGREAVLFLEDMGRFVLAALPYLAGAAVLAAVTMVIRSKQRNK